MSIFYIKSIFRNLKILFEEQIITGNISEIFLLILESLGISVIFFIRHWEPVRLLSGKFDRLRYHIVKARFSRFNHAYD